MKTNKVKRVKSINFISGAPIDIYNGSVDVFVTLENDDSKYWLEVTTPQALVSHMDERNQRFLFCLRIFFSFLQKKGFRLVSNI